jgi:glycosyltransferase involved in cell wall biosynthesis
VVVSLVIPVLNESENIPALWQRLATVCAGIPGKEFEVIFVDDGSTDGTPECVAKLRAEKNIRWLLVRLSRNFGHQAAVSAGMQHASGDAVAVLDADLQDPPELLPQFLAKIEEGYDVAYGVRKNRKEPLWLRFCFSGFYRLFNSIAERPIPLDAGDFGVISRRVAQLLASMPERDRLLRGMRSWVGFKQIGIEYDRPARHSGESRYRLSKRIDGALDGLFGFSRVPIRFSLIVGLLVILIGGGYLTSAFLGTVVFGGKAVPGWKSLLTLGFMLGGANLVAVAIVGEYVCRIYFQVKGRPLFIVAQVSESGSPAKIAKE